MALGFRDVRPSKVHRSPAAGKGADVSSAAVMTKRLSHCRTSPIPRPRTGDRLASAKPGEPASALPFDQRPPGLADQRRLFRQTRHRLCPRNLIVIESDRRPHRMSPMLEA
jgi:hypothetical protein